MSRSSPPWAFRPQGFSGESSVRGSIATSSAIPPEPWFRTPRSPDRTGRARRCQFKLRRRVLVQIITPGMYSVKGEKKGFKTADAKGRGGVGKGGVFFCRGARQNDRAQRQARNWAPASTHCGSDRGCDSPSIRSSTSVGANLTIPSIKDSRLDAGSQVCLRQPRVVEWWRRWQGKPSIFLRGGPGSGLENLYVATA